MLRLVLGMINKIVSRLIAIGRAPLTWLLLKTDETIEVGYWNIRGLAAPLRMMCVYAGARFKVVDFEAIEKPGGGYVTDKWFKDTKPALLRQNALTNLPYVKAESTVVTQSNACLTFLARRFDLMGSSEDEVTKNEQCMCQVMDMRNDAVGLFYGGFGPDKQEVFESKKIVYYEKNVTVHYSKFENWLQQKGTKYLAADSPTAADFHFWEMLDQHEELGRFLKKPSHLDSYPLLQAYYVRFRALPQLKAYFDGPLAKYPINNKMAAFGAK
mmetsp:Transcript_11098/g.32854  ORF Transcript_11098/g.32854 Transcript_11098/m.32854 type:complete len:270 (+) Transcript_11098:68-877(+)